MTQNDPGHARLTERTETMFCVGAALVLVLIGIVGWTLIEARRSATRQAEESASNMALSLERDIGRFITILDLSLRAVAQDLATPELASNDPTVRKAILLNDATPAAGFGGIFIADETGRLVYASLASVKPGINLADRPFFQAQRDQPDLGLTISDPIIGRNDGELGVALTRRINHPDGRFAGVVVARLRLGYFRSLFGATNVGRLGTIALIGTDQRLIAGQPYDEHRVGRDMSESPVFRALASAPAGHFTYTFRGDGIARLYAYRKINTLPLVLVVGLATRDVYADWVMKSVMIGGVLLSLSALGLGLAWLLRRELRRRVLAEDTARQAAAAAERLAGELADALAPLDALFRNSADAMLVAHIQPDGMMRYEAVNPVWREMVGAPAADAAGDDQAAFPPAQIDQMILDSWHDCVRENRAIRVSFESPPPVAREWDILVVPIIGKHGGIDRLIAVGREITERNRLEERLRQSQKMEVIGRLAAGVSHDFNNILQVISGGVETLGDEKSLSPPGREALDMVSRATRRGSYLTHHLLSYSRKQTLNPEVLDLVEILDNLNVVLSRTLGTDIVVTTEFTETLGRVRADRNLLETALMNLAINAAHAMPDGGALHFDISTMEAPPFGELRPGRHVVIAVTDTGTGITPEVLACIFDPFFTTKGVEGTGLGLAMVQGFSRQSGGDVRAFSKPGEGTRFEIWLPEADDQTLPDQPAEPAAAIVQPGHVLLVDDAEDVLITLSAFLRAGGFSVHQARGAEQALAALADGERFDLLITDYLMPTMKGLELVRQARLLRPGLPALVVSGFADVAEIMDDLPDTVLLQKPFQRARLLAHASALIAQSRRGNGSSYERSRSSR